MVLHIIGEAVVGTTSIPEGVGGAFDGVDAVGGVLDSEMIVTEYPGSHC